MIDIAFDDDSDPVTLGVFHAFFDELECENDYGNRALEFDDDRDGTFENYIEDETRKLIFRVLSANSRSSKKENIFLNIKKCGLFSDLYSNFLMASNSSLNPISRDRVGLKYFKDRYENKNTYKRSTLRKTKKEKTVRVPFNLSESANEKFKLFAESQGYSYNQMLRRAVFAAIKNPDILKSADENEEIYQDSLGTSKWHKSDTTPGVNLS